MTVPPITGALRLEYVAIDDLPPHPENPKGHALDLIEESMDRWGYTQPVLICERAQKLAAGHGRREVLIRKRDRGDDPPVGVERTPDGTWFAPMIRGWRSKDDDELRAYLVADNRTSEVGGWLDDQLLGVLQATALKPDGLRGIGYSAEDIEALRRATSPPVEPKVDPDDVPELPAEGAAVTQEGDVWLMGAYTICPHCGEENDL